MHPALVAAPINKQAPAGLLQQRHWCSSCVHCSGCSPADPSHVFHLVRVKVYVIVHSLTDAAHHQLAGAASTCTRTQAVSGAACSAACQACSCTAACSSRPGPHDMPAQSQRISAQIQAISKNSLALLLGLTYRPGLGTYDVHTADINACRPERLNLNQIAHCRARPLEKCRSMLLLLLPQNSWQVPDCPSGLTQKMHCI